MTAARVSIDKTRRHLAKLHAANMATTYIAAAAGVDPSTIYDITHGRRDYINAATAKRICAVKPDPDGNHGINATGVVRRIQTMIGEGHTQTWIAEQLGWPEMQIYRLLAGRRTRITRDSRQLVDDLYRATDGRPPADTAYATHARGRARDAGWPPRDAWYDDTIDNPNIGPYFTGHLTDQLVDDILVQRAIDGDPTAVDALNRAERLEATRRLLQRGVGAGGICRRLNVSGATANRLVAEVAA